MALLRALERAAHSEVSDLITRSSVLLFENVANEGKIEEKLHCSILSPILQDGIARYTFGRG
jgi:hypothetical protein